MENQVVEPVTRWIGDPKAGNAVAAQKTWAQYFAALIRSKLRARQRAAVDEDILADRDGPELPPLLYEPLVPDVALRRRHGEQPMPRDYQGGAPSYWPDRGRLR